MLPLPNLDDKTFTQLVEDAKKQIPRFAPEWTDYNHHDPGVTMIELFAWLTEGLQYYVDQIRDENEIKFLKLLGIKRMEAACARVDVSFTFKPNNRKSSVLVPRGTKLAAGELIFETEEEIRVVPAELEKIISTYGATIVDHTETSSHAGFTFMAFGDKAEAGSRLYLGFDRSFPAGKIIPITFNLFEDYPVARAEQIGETLEITPSAKLEWEYLSKDGHWKPIVVKDGTHELSHSGRIYYAAPGDSAKLKLFPTISSEHYWIRCTLTKAGYELPPKMVSIVLNTTQAKQINTHKYELIGRSCGLPAQTFSLSRAPVVSESLLLQVKEMHGDEAVWTHWLRVDDLDASKPTDRHYVLDADNGRIIFGNGVHGAIPKPPADEEEDNIRMVRYQTTSGEEGNVGAGTINRILGPEAELLTVINRTAAFGGEPGESLDQAKTRARRDLKVITRAVTSDDFEWLALHTPGLRVARAKALPLIAADHVKEQKGAVVTVVVVPYSRMPNPIPSDGFIKTVFRHLYKHRLITTEVRVIPPDYVKVSIDAVVTLKQGYKSADTQQAIQEALLAFLHPLEGGPEGEGWPFGRTVYKSEIYAVIDQVPGVEGVQRLQLYSQGTGVTQDSGGNLQIRPFSLVYSDTHRVEVTNATLECRA